MEVIRVVPSGYCKGVVNAINIAKKVKEDNPNTPVYVLGMMVHNTYVTEQLTKLGIITLDDSKKSKEELLDDIDHGIVCLTAHGTSDAIKNKAIKKGLKAVNGSRWNAGYRANDQGFSCLSKIGFSLRGDECQVAGLCR